jgi:hypothetical protein
VSLSEVPPAINPKFTAISQADFHIYAPFFPIENKYLCICEKIGGCRSPTIERFGIQNGR